MPRSPHEVFQRHAEALGAGDLDGIVEDYSDDAVFITPDGIKRGKDGIRDLPGRADRLQTVRYTLQHTS